jgi:hypothetical protein
MRPLARRRAMIERPRARAHPDPEAMRLGTLTIVRLEGTLHDDGS